MHRHCNCCTTNLVAFGICKNAFPLSDNLLLFIRHTASWCDTVVTRSVVKH